MIPRYYKIFIHIQNLLVPMWYPPNFKPHHSHRNVSWRYLPMEDAIAFVAEAHCWGGSTHLKQYLPLTWQEMFKRKEHILIWEMNLLDDKIEIRDGQVLWEYLDLHLRIAMLAIFGYLVPLVQALNYGMELRNEENRCQMWCRVIGVMVFTWVGYTWKTWKTYLKSKDTVDYTSTLK